MSNSLHKAIKVFLEADDSEEDPYKSIRKKRINDAENRMRDQKEKDFRSSMMQIQKPQQRLSSIPMSKYPEYNPFSGGSESPNTNKSDIIKRIAGMSSESPSQKFWRQGEEARMRERIADLRQRKQEKQERTARFKALKSQGNIT